MAAEIVVSPNEASINAVRYPIVGNVQRSLASTYPEKTVIGDYTKDSSPILSTLALSDHRGGIGLDIMSGDGDTDRSWYSTAETRYKGHLILPPLVTNTGNLPTGLAGTYNLASYKGVVYANVDATTDGIYAYTLGTDTWGANLHAVSMTGNYRWAVARVSGTAYLVLGGITKYVYFDGTSWATGTNLGASWVLGWLDRLWGIVPSTLWYTFTPGSAEVSLGKSPSIYGIGGDYGQLFVAKDASGEEIPYLALPTGLFAYDIDNDKWIPTALQFPGNLNTAYAGLASGVNWRGNIYYAARSSIFKYSVQGNSATIASMGPDQDNGLPSSKGRLILAMIPTLNDLIVSVTSRSGDNKKSLILAWNGTGWRVLYEATGNDEYLLNLLEANVADNNYLFFSNNTTAPYNISYMSLPSDLVNPLQITTYAYAAAATHDWPWFTAGQSDVTKVAVRVKVETVNPTTSETVKVYYAINRSATFQLMTNSTYTTGIITASGIHTFDFPSVDSWLSTTARTGTAFRSIQFRVVFARGGTTTNTPDVLSLTLEYYKKLDPKYQFIVTLDLSQEYKGNTPRALRAALLAAQETATLVEFTYHDVGNDSDATFYVQVRPQVSEEETGLSEKGRSQLLLVEV